jgi:hypothetical protein
MLKVIEYLERAEACEALMKTARTPIEVKGLQQMAAMWRELAEARDREIRRFERLKEPQSPSAGK